jgi:hypothetical protein
MNIDHYLAPGGAARPAADEHVFGAAPDRFAAQLRTIIAAPSQLRRHHPRYFA